MTLEIHQFPCLSDNFGVIIRDPQSGLVASIDAPEFTAVDNALAEKGWTLTHILTTHHHPDHVDGNLALKEKYGCTIIGPLKSKNQIPGIDETVSQGDTVQFGSLSASVYEAPGHTLDHIVYHFESEAVAFVADVIFAMGCGRVLEGDLEMMWSSIEKLIGIFPPETTLYCGHEYTLANAKFSITIEPDNEDLKARLKEVEALRAQGKPTLPTTMARELATNPFVRAANPAVAEALGMTGSSAAQVFAEVRTRKDNA